MTPHLNRHSENFWLNKNDSAGHSERKEKKIMKVDRRRGRETILWTGMDFASSSRTTEEQIPMEQILSFKCIYMYNYPSIFSDTVSTGKVKSKINFDSVLFYPITLESH